jgi:hypothetical protein
MTGELRLNETRSIQSITREHVSLPF